MKFEDSERNYSPELTEYLLAEDRAFLPPNYEGIPMRLRRKIEFGARVYPTYGRGLIMRLG